ncbi:hypothetical protein, conserved [Plasmodium gonderi]|uniref:JAB1/MPN/MOV34 metalloenzyme domain-containing protein n=1 Tax=Plasmodium gonderi TaxID=77519 RepID=A0A1Y1JGQ1_PLAGO|nr:hypothetical protein, conserved [Plasmodium gonderi]GAW79942.1 hypothetical protein, conserved [Plasmodium gonderi]
MKKELILLVWICFLFARIKFEGLKINRNGRKPLFSLTGSRRNRSGRKPLFSLTGSRRNRSGRKPLFSLTEKNEKKFNANRGSCKNNVTNNTHGKKLNEKIENKFLQFENSKRTSINPLFDSICKHVSVSETCLHNVQEFFNEMNYNNLRNGNPKNNKLFCGVLYGKYENEKIVKIENVFFSVNGPGKAYDVHYLLDSEERKKADKLAKMLNLQVVGFLYAYPDIGIDLSVSNKKKKNFIKINKKMKTLNDEENELFIPMGGREVLLSLMLMKQTLSQHGEYSTGGEGRGVEVRNEGEAGGVGVGMGDTSAEKKNHEDETNESNGSEQVKREVERTPSEKNSQKRTNHTRMSTYEQKMGDLKSKESSRNQKVERKKKKKKKKILNVKPFITLSVGMDINSKSIIVEAYEINYDLMKLLNKDIIKDMEKQNSILQFEKTKDEKNKKIKNFDNEIDLMNELYLKCKNNIFIKKIELKKIDILFCVNNVPIFSHKSLYNSFFPYPNNNNYYSILQKFNNMSKTLHRKEDMVNLFRDFNFLFFLTNIFSIQYDIPSICKAVNNMNNSTSIPDQYINILKNLSKSANMLQ